MLSITYRDKKWTSLVGTIWKCGRCVVSVYASEGGVIYKICIEREGWATDYYSSAGTLLEAIDIATDRMRG